MSGGELSKARLDRMRAVMAGHVERGVPGLVTLISRRGEVHVETLGMKAAGGPGAVGNGPMRRDTIFRIASMTKPITAVAAMMLVEECKLRLDEPVDRAACDEDELNLKSKGGRAMRFMVLLKAGVLLSAENLVAGGSRA